VGGSHATRPMPAALPLRGRRRRSLNICTRTARPSRIVKTSSGADRRSPALAAGCPLVIPAKTAPPASVSDTSSTSKCHPCRVGPVAQELCTSGPPVQLFSQPSRSRPTCPTRSTGPKTAGRRRGSPLRRWPREPSARAGLLLRHRSKVSRRHEPRRATGADLPARANDSLIVNGRSCDPALRRPGSGRSAAASERGAAGEGAICGLCGVGALI